MSEHPIRVVVGEGHPARRGLLRFVLEGEGMEVVASATTSAELARVLAVHQPDAVVMDDGIGATAVPMSREVSPGTKIVLVWPGAVVPIGGDARVEPSQVLRSLAGTVERVVAPTGRGGTLQQPDWVDKVRKDPATLRFMLARRAAPPPARPSVTELQKRGQRLHPIAPATSDPEPGPAVVPLPHAETPDDATIVLPDDDRAAILAIGVAAAAGNDGDAVVPTPAGADRERDRKLGALALAGAAVIGAAAISFALSGTRLRPELVIARAPDPFLPGPAVVWSPPPSDDPTGPDGGGGPKPPPPR